jgi:hypothetical protein
MDYEIHLLIEEAQRELGRVQKELVDARDALERARGEPPGTMDTRSLELLCDDLDARRQDLKEQLEKVAGLVRQFFDRRPLTDCSASP